MTAARRVHPTLPVFEIDVEPQGTSLLYVPGYVVTIPRGRVQEYTRAVVGGLAGVSATQCAERLRQQAVAVIDEWERMAEAPFDPECLTVYLSNQCNAACTYCYAAPHGRNGQGQVLLPILVRAAARLVAGNCERRSIPFQLVVHGGGEPTQHFALLQEIYEHARLAAAERKVRFKAYIATNGMFPEWRSGWLAERFGTVGLSCDGPPEIQDLQRPFASGAPSSGNVMRTAQALKRAGTRLGIRTTITSDTVGRQAEIVRYLHEQLHADEIRFEPNYTLASTSGAGAIRLDPDEFVAGFMNAKRVANDLGVPLSFSGVRFGELHGPFCNVLKQSLHLTPDGRAVGCFFALDGGSAPHQVIGEYDSTRDCFVVDTKRAWALRRASLEIPATCRDCVSIYHCSRGCPEFCLAHRDDSAKDPGRTNRCQLNQRLTVACILNEAGIEPTKHQEPVAMPGPRSSQDTEQLRRLLAELPVKIDECHIIEDFARLGARYPIRARGLPAPLWATRRFQLNGREALKFMRTQRPLDRSGAISVYVHFPFCDRRCAFCDCLSRPISRDCTDQGRKFVEMVLRELEIWSECGALSARAVTTVHFGGGTPGMLQTELFEQLVGGLRARLQVQRSTQWAVESTATLLNSDHLETLLALGFRRLHVGVQSLENEVRRRIGRRLNRSEVLSRLELAIRKELTTSIDMIFGLPGDTSAGFVDGLKDAVASGVHGVSLYGLNRSTRNERFLQRVRYLPDSLRSYALFLAGDYFLSSQGFSKNHFAHYARLQDDNRYYRHRVRGEDLLALGPTADGVFGDLHYRHQDWPEYCESMTSAAGLEGALIESAAEARLEPLLTAIMCGEIDQKEVRSLEFQSLFARWREIGFVSLQDDVYKLTGNGSWFIRDMIEELCSVGMNESGEGA